MDKEIAWIAWVVRWNILKYCGIAFMVLGPIFFLIIAEEEAGMNFIAAISMFVFGLIMWFFGWAMVPDKESKD